MAGYPWTDEAFTTVQKMWTDGLSATEIAARMGNGMTRSAVIGKLHRNQVKNGHKPVPRKFVPRMARPPKGRIEPSLSSPIKTPVKASSAFRSVPMKMPLVKPVAQPSPIDPARQPVPISDLSPNGCKFAVSPHHAVLHVFCDQPRQEGTPYCTTHMRVVIAERAA